jgi:hypothetical protein
MMPISGPTVALAITMLVGMGLWTIDYKRDAGFELTMCVAQSSAAPRLRARAAMPRGGAAQAHA